MFIAYVREQEQRRRNVSSLRTGVVAGAICPPELMRKIIDVLGVEVCSHLASAVVKNINLIV